MDELEEDDFLALDTELDEEDFTPDDEGGIDWYVVTDVLDSVLPYYNETLDFFGGQPAPSSPAATETTEPTNYTGLYIIGAVLLITVIGLVVYNRKKKK